MISIAPSSGGAAIWITSLIDTLEDLKPLNLNPAMAQFLMYSTPEEMLSSLKEPLWPTVVSAERQADFMTAMKDIGLVRGFEMEVFRRPQQDLDHCKCTSYIQRRCHLRF